MEKVTISNLQGENGLVNVVRYFTNNGIEYLIYSLNEIDETGYTRLYVTKLNGVDGNYTADIPNENEWAEIKNLVKVIVKANKEKLPLPIQDINPKKIKNITLKDKKIFKLNSALVNDLSANQPNFADDDSGAEDGGISKNMFETPTQPTFEMPSTPTFEAPTQPAFEMPSTPTFEAPTQPAFEMPSTPTFEAPTQPAFEMPSTPTFEAPTQPAFDFSANNLYNNTAESTSSKSVESLEKEIKRLNDEIVKYKEIIGNIQNLIKN